MDRSNKSKVVKAVSDFLTAAIALCETINHDDFTIVALHCTSDGSVNGVGNDGSLIHLASASSYNRR